MNRQILFKGKRVDNDEWVYGYLVEATNVITDKIETFIIEQDATYFTHGEFACSYEVKPETVGGFTNLTDKNGNKIFEGDIVKVGRELTISIGYPRPKLIETKAPTKIFFVIYSVKLGCFCLSEKYNTDYETITSDCEIIGNIHDNKENKE